MEGNFIEDGVYWHNNAGAGFLMQPKLVEAVNIQLKSKMFLLEDELNTGS